MKVKEQRVSKGKDTSEQVYEIMYKDLKEGYAALKREYDHLNRSYQELRKEHEELDRAPMNK